jgi:hypothetical protein
VPMPTGGGVNHLAAANQQVDVHVSQKKRGGLMIMRISQASVPSFL